MIKINGQYQIDADAYQFIVRKLISTSKDTGEKKYSAVAYVSSLDRAIRFICEAEHRDVVAEDDMSLSEALKRFEKINDDFNETLDEIKNSEEFKR